MHIMDRCNPRDRVLDALSGETPEIPPVAIFTQSSTLSQMENTGSPWPLAHSDPAMMAALGSAQHRMFGFDSVRVPFCVTVEAGALGCDVSMSGRSSPPSVIPGRYSLDPLNGKMDDPSCIPQVDEFLSDPRVGCVSDSVRLLSSHLDDVPVIAGVTGPLTTLTQMVGAEGMVLGSIMCPEIVRSWSSEITVRLKAYIGLLEDSGADVILLGEASGSPDLIEPSMMMHLTGDFLKGMSVGHSKRVLHMCGDVNPVLNDLSILGFSGLSLEGAMDPFDTVSKIGERVALVGNVGPVDPLLTGTPQDVLDASRRSLEAGFDIIAPGCGVPVQTTDENLRAMLRVRH